MNIRDAILSSFGTALLALVGYGLHMNDRVVVLETRMEQYADMKEMQKNSLDLMGKMNARLSVMEALLKQQLTKDK
jgi:hypothetical protein